MTDTPPDVERLIQDVLADLGFDADAGEVARRVRKLNYGLPAEDEFAVICAWLGRTLLLHKLDQHQVPARSRSDFQVPDILAIFDATGPFLIEVKVCNDRTLSFKPDYYARLMRYSDQMGLPLLLAWKHYSLWTLVDIRHVTLARRNFNISYEEAMRQNLLGILVGDVAFKLAKGAGIHLDIAKEQLIETRPTVGGSEETWQMRVTGVHFTAGGGAVRTDLHPETIQLFSTWDLQSSEDHSPTQVRQSFTVGEEGVEFAHRALVGLLAWEKRPDETTNWRTLLRSPEITRSIEHFGAALERGLGEGVVHCILRQQPETIPDFIHQKD